MRIVYICNEYPPLPHGGLGIYVQSIARAVAENGHDVTILGLGDSPDERYDGRVRVITLPSTRMRGIAWFANRARIWRWLQRELREHGIDVVEIPEYEGMLPFPFNGCAVVVRLHNSATAIAQLAGHDVSPVLRWCERQTLARHRDWTAGAHHVFDLTRKMFGVSPAREIVWRVPFVYERPTRDWDLPRRFILFAGTVRQDKGAVALARATRRLLAADPDLHMVYAGRVLLEAGRSVGDRIREEFGPVLCRRVHFAGGIPRGDVLAIMRRATVFALPSKLEASPMVVAEAMMSGCPVVLPDMAPFSEVIEAGRSGLLVPPGDEVALGEAIQRILGDPELAASLASEARRAAEHSFAPGFVLADAIRFYQQCSHDTQGGASHG